jgi:hypothetical protein
MDLDRDVLPHNTSEVRAASTNTPAWTEDLTFPSWTPAPLHEWVGNLARASHAHPRRWASTSLALHGSFGTGKTGVGSCALRALAVEGVGSTFYWNMVTGPILRAQVEAGEAAKLPSPCWYESWSRLLSLHRRERWDEESWFSHLEERVGVLMLDDVGVDAGTPFRESFFLRHLEWAVDRPGRALVVTINADPEDWEVALGQRVADRVSDPARFTLVRLAGRTRR